MEPHVDVAIIGGGISGLTAAFWLRRAGMETVLLERQAWLGGTIRSVREDGWLIETGPNSALETTPLIGRMCEALGILDERTYANPVSNKRYILREGRLHPIPLSPPAFLTSRLWTTAGKLRLLKEPFIGRGTKEETVAEFVERRLGREFLDYAINPFVAGVYAGNPEQLSVRTAFPKLYALEEKYGGLIKGMVMGAKERTKRAETAKDRAKMFSFAEGMQTFPRAIGVFLGDSVKLESRVSSLVPLGADGSTGRAGFRVSYEKYGRAASVAAGAVVIAVPAHAVAELMERFSPPAEELFGSIFYPPVAEVFLGYKESQCTRPLDGFGFLVPAKERRSILGTIWSSALFPNRAPTGYVALTTFVGGSRQPEILQCDDKDLSRLVKDELADLMGVRGDPAFTRVIRWEKAIPQYNLGYHTVLAALDHLETEVPGLYFCSNFRGGIAVGDCVMSGERIAAQVMKFVQQRNDERPRSIV